MPDPDYFNVNALAALGWAPFFAEQAEDHPTLIPARVSRPDKSRYHLLTAAGPLFGLLPGRGRSHGQTKADLPTVGDWLLVSLIDDNLDADTQGTALIEVTLDRQSKFSRKEAGERYEEQVVAANIDTVFLVTGLDDNFNVKRIERYLMLAWTSGASPVVVLSKADLATDLPRKLDKVKKIAMDAPIHVVSATTDQGMAQLRDYVTPGKTIALLGSSGVGKSTMTNYLLGQDYYDTGAVRSSDSRGRHTTTYRELCLLETGGMLIDTPGMREIQIWADQDSLAASFADITTLATLCRFNDCRHHTEPHCAVQTAIRDGTLPSSRLATFEKFTGELALLTARNSTQGKPEKAKPTKIKPEKRWPKKK